MVPDILIPLIVVGLAELGDKTQLSTLLLASKTDKHIRLFLGTILAFLIVDGIAILAKIAGISFIFMGVAFLL